MRAHEFIIQPTIVNGRIVEDISNLQDEILRKMLSKNPKLFEDSVDFKELRDFLNLHDQITEPIIGNLYTAISVKSIPIGKILHIAQLDKECKLVRIQDSYLYFEYNGKEKRFPEGENIGGDQLQHTLLFVTTKLKDYFILLLTTKFSDWIIGIDNLS